MLSPSDRARALLGTPFRPQGRSAELGLDCIGVALHCFGINDVPLPTYRVTDGNWPLIERMLSEHFARACSSLGERDQLFVCEMPRSFHFGVCGEGIVIHSDLRCRRVIESPLAAFDSARCRRFYEQLER